MRYARYFRFKKRTQKRTRKRTRVRWTAFPVTGLKSVAPCPPPLPSPLPACEKGAEKNTNEGHFRVRMRAVVRPREARPCPPGPPGPGGYNNARHPHGQHCIAHWRRRHASRPSFHLTLPSIVALPTLRSIPRGPAQKVTPRDTHTRCMATAPSQHPGSLKEINPAAARLSVRDPRHRQACPWGFQSPHGWHSL